MALIICEKCGKKVSDTLKVCIHCGAVIGKAEPKDEKIKEIKIDEGINYIRFSSFSEEEKQKLEEEFLKNDQIALKEHNALNYSKKFKSLIWLYAFLFFSSMLIVKCFFKDYLFSYDALNEKFLELGLICLTIFISVLLLTAIANFIGRIRLRKAYVRYTYLKRFQQWLLKEKNIDYVPILKNKKQIKIFNNIKINN